MIQFKCRCLKCGRGFKNKTALLNHRKNPNDCSGKGYAYKVAPSERIDLSEHYTDLRWSVSTSSKEEGKEPSKVISSSGETFSPEHTYNFGSPPNNTGASAVSGLGESPVSTEAPFLPHEPDQNRPENDNKGVKIETKEKKIGEKI